MLNYVRSFPVVPKQGTKSAQIFAPQFVIIALRERRCSKGLMDDTGQHGYRFDNASMTESRSVGLGPLPLLVYGAWGKEPN
jgi:hypothetical protein